MEPSNKVLAWIVLLAVIVSVTYLRREGLVPTWATITTLVFSLLIVLSSVTNKQP